MADSDSHGRRLDVYTQFGSGDTFVLSIRAKLLLMLQATLSIAVIVFIASIAIGNIR